MMALLYETIPAFEDTWIECLGDLARYRMAIEDDDHRDREIWTFVSRQWYTKASDRAPTVGRLYHHLAILARPNAVQQLYFYSKSLTVATPFDSSRISIATLFDPVLNGTSRLTGPDLYLVKLAAILFTGRLMEDFDSTKAQLKESLDSHITRSGKRWLEPGAYYALSLSCAELQYADHNAPLMRAITSNKDPVDPTTDQTPAATLTQVYEKGAMLALDTDRIVFPRYGDLYVLGYLHCRLVFMLYLTNFVDAFEHLARYHWKLLTQHLNFLIADYRDYKRIESLEFPEPTRGEPRPLPEDWFLRGFLFAEKAYPDAHFQSDKVDLEEKLMEVASMMNERKERVLWLGYCLANRGRWITYDPKEHLFSVAPEFDVQLESDGESDINQMDIDEIVSEKEDLGITDGETRTAQSDQAVATR